MTNTDTKTYRCGRGEHFGCGAINCSSCYPFTYRCPDGHDYLTPVPNGEPEPDCPHEDCEFTAEYMAEIGWITNTDE